VTVLVLSVTIFAGSASAKTYPHSMASTGDSITRAYNTGLPYADAPENSWATGGNPSVQSHYLRLLAPTPAIRGKAYNDARSGAKMVDLAGQMSTVAGQGVDYVTVEIGGNDLCTSSVSTMTDVAVFRSQFVAAMDAIARSPKTKVFVAGIPDACQLWTLFKDDDVANFFWALLGICQSLLANPRSTAPEDVARRAQVRQRNIDFNAQLRQVCALYAQCRWDGGAVFDTTITTADVSTRDYFHPSLAGQTKLAAVTWNTLSWNAWHN
jgi:lysophospholipase L1-like esterase